MGTEDVNAMRNELESLKRENAKLKERGENSEKLMKFFKEEYGKLVTSTGGPRQHVPRSLDTEELEKRYAPFFDGNSPKFNLTEASKFTRDNPSVGKALLERFEETWSTGKFAVESRKGN